MIFLGIDWAEAHHDVCLLNEGGRVLASGRVPDGVDGVARLQELVAQHASDADEVIVGIELDRGLLVGALLASGYQLYAMNPLWVDRYRDRHRTSGAKSDPGDAKVLADIVRTGHNHRPVAGDTEGAEAIKVLARAHKDLNLVAPAPDQPAAQPAAGVLSPGACLLRLRARLRRRAGRAGAGAVARAGAATHGVSDPGEASPRRPEAEPQAAWGGDLRGPAQPPARGAPGPDRRLRRPRPRARGGAARDGGADREPGAGAPPIV